MEDETSTDPSDGGTPTGQDGDAPAAPASILGFLRERDVIISLGLFLFLLLGTALISTYSVGNIGLYLLFMILSIVMLIYSSDRTLTGAVGIAKKAGIAEVIIGLTIVSIGTSLPEIASTAMASVQSMQPGKEGLADFAIGNIYGSVLVQITLITGLVVIMRPMELNRSAVKRDGSMMILAVGLLTGMILLDVGGAFTLARHESVILMLIYILYLVYLVRNREAIFADEASGDPEGEVGEMLEREYSTLSYGFMLGLGLTLVIIASNYLVENAVNLATELGIPEGVIGVTICAFGTSVPELAVSLSAIKKAKGLAFGTLVGSNITDPLMSIGIAGMINPITVSEPIFNISAYITIVICGIAVVFMWSGLKLKRWEGSVLVGAYITFLVLLFTVGPGSIG